MIVKQIPVGPMANFVYLVVDEESREAMVVDSGWETLPILKAVKAAGAKVRYVVATHGHFDHVSTLPELGEALGARVVGHESSELKCDIRVSDGQTLQVGRADVKVLYTPGHTDDSICLYDGVEVFTGDTLFVGNIGRFDMENMRTLYESLFSVILKLPPSTMMYPGHDYGDVPSRTLAEERKENPYLTSASFTGFASLFG